MANIANITFYKGEDVTITVTMSPATNITSWTFVFTAKDKLGGTQALQKTNASFTIADALNGVFRFTLSATDTGTTLSVRTYVYDIQRTNSGSATVLVTGNLKVLGEVTN